MPPTLVFHDNNNSALLLYIIHKVTIKDRGKNFSIAQGLPDTYIFDVSLIILHAYGTTPGFLGD